MIPLVYAVRNLFRRFDQTIQLIIGSVIVILLVMSASAMNDAMENTLLNTGNPNNIIVLGAGSEESVERSEIKAGIDEIIASSIFGIRQIVGKPAVSPEVLLDYTASADIGISIIENTCLSYFFCMPNKLFEYTMAGLPVIVSNMKEMAEEVQNADFGIVLTDYSIEAINYAIDRLLSQDLARFSKNAYQFAVTSSWEHQELKLIEAYEMIIQ